jgi:hypothetical protein
MLKGICLSVAVKKRNIKVKYIQRNSEVLLQIVLQDKYNIGALTVNIKCMWLSTKRMEGLSIS